MQIFFKDEQAYLVKAALISARNKKMMQLSTLPLESYQERSRINWEISQYNYLLDNYEKAVCMLFVP